MKRLVSLDLMRGFAILAMIFSHALIFGPFYPTQNPGEGGAPPIDVLVPGAPNEMTPPFFFFVTGMSLAVSLFIRITDRKQSLTRITRHVLIRNVVLILIGTLVTPLLGLMFRQSFAVSDIASSISHSFGNDVIAMIGWVNLLAFPLVFFLSWKTLLALTAGVFVLVSVVLSLVPNPFTSTLLTSLLLTGDFSALKTLPIALLGGALGKTLVEKKKSIGKWAGALGLLAFALFLVTLQFLGGGIGFGGGRKLYHFAFAMTVGFCLMALGLFKIIENRGFKLIPVAVVGRTALWVYIAHEILLGFLVIVIPHNPNALITWVYGFLPIAILWPFAYIYARWRWGNPADQYEEPIRDSTSERLERKFTKN
jgi:uncharacterized membrane protein